MAPDQDDTKGDLSSSPQDEDVDDSASPFSTSDAVTSRLEKAIAASNPFDDGVATKEIHINPFTSLSIRIFLPESALNPSEPSSKPRRNSYGFSYGFSNVVEGLNLMAGVCSGVYRGYSPGQTKQEITATYSIKFESREANKSTSDVKSRVSPPISSSPMLYSTAPDNRYLPVFEDGLNWLGKQADITKITGRTESWSSLARWG
ncbi:probable carboxylesterase 11 [Rosa chinensis]|uniref:probable carboxylesterase 11 n=1 Tax=Rosa chinensis TaxID=74649 RepID=UPI000D091A74|nr:probable carboxylesterase 11 [Rosa chinensis]